MSEKEIYFNFPIQLLDGFMVNSCVCLCNIFDYSITKQVDSLEYESEIKKIKEVHKRFGVELGNYNMTIKNGRDLIDSIPVNSPRTGITKSTFFEFNKNDKSDFEKACLLAFLAIKSIIGDKPYCKMTNAFFLSRMDGKPKSVEPGDLSPVINRYANEYQTKKIRLELSANWGMSFYAKATKGFFASTQMNVDDLTYKVLLSKKTDKYQAVKDAAKNAELKAKLRLGITMT